MSETESLPSDDATAHARHGIDAGWVLGFWQPTPAWRRIALALASILCLAVFWFGSNLFATPPLSRFDGSLFCNPSPLVGTLVTAVLFLVCTMLGTVVAGAVESEAGLFAAALGLVVVSMRSGTIQAVIFETGGTQTVFFKLAAEILVLSVILAVAWLMLARLGKPALPGETSPPAEPRSLPQGLAALATQVIATGILVEFLCVTEAKNQAIGSVFVASIVGAVAAYSCFPAKSGYCFWAGPLVLGFIGYLIAAFGGVGGIAIGHLSGTFAPLARPLPVDYASVGAAGALLGRWAAIGWNAES